MTDPMITKKQASLLVHLRREQGRPYDGWTMSEIEAARAIKLAKASLAKRPATKGHDT